MNKLTKDKLLTILAYIGSATKWVVIGAICGVGLGLFAICGFVMCRQVMNSEFAQASIKNAIIFCIIIYIGNQILKYWRWSYDYLCRIECKKRQAKANAKRDLRNEERLAEKRARTK